MPQFHQAGSVKDLVPGTGKTVTLEGRCIALFKVDGAFHAIDNTCPHRQGPLGEGEFDGKVVTCPWHGWTFDVTTGKCGINPAAKVAVYPVKVEGDLVMVEV